MQNRRSFLPLCSSLALLASLVSCGSEAPSDPADTGQGVEGNGMGMPTGMDPMVMPPGNGVTQPGNVNGEVMVPTDTPITPTMPTMDPPVTTTPPPTGDLTTPVPPLVPEALD